MIMSFQERQGTETPDRSYMKIKAELSYTQKSQITTGSRRRQMSVLYRLQEE